MLLAGKQSFALSPRKLHFVPSFFSKVNCSRDRTPKIPPHKRKKALKSSRPTTLRSTRKFEIFRPKVKTVKMNCREIGVKLEDVDVSPRVSAGDFERAWFSCNWHRPRLVVVGHQHLLAKVPFQLLIHFFQVGDRGAVNSGRLASSVVQPHFSDRGGGLRLDRVDLEKRWRGGVGKCDGRRRGIFVCRSQDGGDNAQIRLLAQQSTVICNVLSNFGVDRRGGSWADFRAFLLR
mmetsp:Transcript_8644/g.12880  ORF Transcript_8644/g.12880 Transcript_8644/m.12880 type:complete len:233 (+) Transcript_8644:557-1255(+)